MDGEEEGERILHEQVGGGVGAEQDGAHGRGGDDALDDVGDDAERGEARDARGRGGGGLARAPGQPAEGAHETARRDFAARRRKKARTSWIGSWSVERNIASIRLRRKSVFRFSSR